MKSWKILSILVPALLIVGCGGEGPETGPRLPRDQAVDLGGYELHAIDEVKELSDEEQTP